MTVGTQYAAAKQALLSDPMICEANRALFAEFFAFQEHKLKRTNGLAELDEGCFKTLYGYIQRLRNVNGWFENKSWRDLTKEDIARVYNGLEDGTIRTRKGTPFQDKTSYYNKVLKSKPFALAGKAELARQVIEYTSQSKPAVRYLTEEGFRSIVSVVANPVHLLLLWLAWDIGENIDALLKLTRRHITDHVNRHTGEREYIVRLDSAAIKRSRQARGEVTLYPETVRYADMALGKLGPDEPVFHFGYRHAAEVLSAAVRRSGAATMPDGQPVRWKDFRSGMACHLLRSGWTRDEVNARLGHVPSSDALNAYINFLALDREAPKRRLLQNTSDALKGELERARQVATLEADRARRQGAQNADLRDVLAATLSDLRSLEAQVKQLAHAIRAA